MVGAGRRAIPKRVACCVAALCLLVSGTAAAFRTGADTGNFGGASRVVWESNYVRFRLHEGAAPGISQESVAQLVDQAFATWSAPRCTNIAFELDGTTDQESELGDGSNTIQWLRTGWKGRGYNPDAAGITEIEYEKTEDGVWHIVEADILLNANHHEWTVGIGAEGQRDVLSVLTHELGHAIGLAHPCEPDGALQAPDCANGDFDETDTMFPEYHPDQSRLTDDARDGVCFLYPGEGCSGEGGQSCPAGFLCVDDDCVVACEDEVCRDDEICTEDGCKQPAANSGPSLEEGVANACQQDDDCRWGQECQERSCVWVRAPVGDPCQKDADCLTRECTSGTCVEECTSDQDCVAGLSCSVQPASATQEDDVPVGSCGENLAAFGEECSDSADCLGGQCLQGAEPIPVCSRVCGESLPDCPEAWSCDLVEGRAVCIPLKEEAVGCSLNAAGPGRERSPNGLWSMLSLFAAAQLSRVGRRC
jgi:hypothetical protein